MSRFYQMEQVEMSLSCIRKNSHTVQEWKDRQHGTEDMEKPPKKDTRSERGTVLTLGKYRHWSIHMWQGGHVYCDTGSTERGLLVPQVTQLYVPASRHVWRSRRMGRIGPLQSTLDGESRSPASPSLWRRNVRTGECICRWAALWFSDRGAPHRTVSSLHRSPRAPV